MKTLLILLLTVPVVLAGASSAAPRAAAGSPSAARQDVQGKQRRKLKNNDQPGAQNGGSTEPRKRRTQKADRGATGVDGSGGRAGNDVKKRKAQRTDGGVGGIDGQGDLAARKKKEPKPLSVVPMGTERKARREAEGLTGAGRPEREGREKKDKTDAASPVAVTRSTDAAADDAAGDATGEAPEPTAPTSAGGDEPRARRPPGKPARQPVNLASELRTHWSRLSRLDQLRAIFLEAGSMEAYQRTDRLRAIENARFQAAMAALRAELGSPRVDSTLEKLSARGGKWERSDWLRGEESTHLE